VTDGKLGIDVSKNTLDASLSSDDKVHAKSFANSSDGWRHLLDWLIARKMRRVHACLESTGLYSLGIACALYDAGHVVSIVNPAQSSRIRVRLLLDRAKPDELQDCLRHALHKAGAPQLMTPELVAALADHAQGNYRALMNMAGELLALAAQRELRQIDEKLFLEAFATPPAPQLKIAAGRRR
jgi:transposase